MSAGYMALRNLGVEFEYHAVEIDKHARTLSDSNFKDIIRWEHDVTAITKEKVAQNGPFDIIMFGAPCQTVSVAGNGTGLQGRSGLIFDCMEVLKWCYEINPDVKFLIENVKMKSSFLDQYDLVINDYYPNKLYRTLLNSADFSAQNRERYYWTNFPIGQHEKVDEILADILEQVDDPSYFINPQNIKSFSEARITWDTNNKGQRSQQDRAFSIDRKSPCMPSNSAHNKMNIYQFVDREKSYCVDANYCKGANLSTYAQRRRQIVFAYSESGRAGGKIEARAKVADKSNTLTTGDGCGGSTKSLNIVSEIDANNIVFRKLTVRECARLQKFPEWYSFDSVSKTQAYKALGNSWTVTVIEHILASGLEIKGLEDWECL